MSPPLNRLVVGALSLGIVLVGCVSQEAGEEEGTVGDGKADGISEFTLKLNRLQDGTLRAKETPKLVGAPSGSTKFTCPTEGRTPDGWRLLCERGDEQLTLTFGPEGLAGAAIYRKSSLAPDKRSYYHCSATTAATDEWPTELQCSAKQPKTLVNGQMISPFAPSLAGVGISNAHFVAEDASSGARLLRGMKPFRDADFEDLQNLGVGAVLIFKRPTASTEVDKEIAALTPIGIPDTRIVNVEFPWKDFADFREPCRMTVQSLKLLRDWTAGGTTAFFHCTVGEDRTGYLAGLYRLLTETAAVDTIFEQELCERGYSAGNPQKPYAGVVKEIDSDLTPLFLKMAFKIATGELTESTLDESVCDVDPAGDPAFADAQWDAAGFQCLVSTRYRL
ncbi:MAG: hypothetical protein H6Q90_2082 [Deltaproteobacteria bacterium]|nr:hypothetical protein [Deltaproteobacteria bacterium]